MMRIRAVERRRRQQGDCTKVGGFRKGGMFRWLLVAAMPYLMCVLLPMAAAKEGEAAGHAVAQVLSDGLRTADIARGSEAIGTVAMGEAVIERLSK